MSDHTHFVSRFLGIPLVNAIWCGCCLTTVFSKVYFCGRDGAVAAMTEDDFYDFAQGLFKSSSQDLPWSEMLELLARAAKSWPRIITLILAASIFCTPQEKSNSLSVRAFSPTFYSF
jgi:hypothetical protein